ncbi:hypothetical protein BRADI_2g16891v3 [Brachypodium distachyon]|uniref:Uncharacterized protein n=1 Tax=Brachypodium distachyon TaxID=15368 RepID=A0A2K2D8X5_BRADI|nr:hypothetical protein BRADI_2g16891v3 [Brachypodium distachyon]
MIDCSQQIKLHHFLFGVAYFCSDMPSHFLTELSSIILMVYYFHDINYLTSDFSSILTLCLGRLCTRCHLPVGY